MNKSKSSILDHVYIAAPCSITWESMSGTDRVRTCSGCDRNVWNLSDMSKSEAEQFIAENGASECAIFYRRKDGTIMNDNCPVGLRMLRQKARDFAGLVAGFLSMVLGAPGVSAQEAPKDTHCYPGNMVIAPPPPTTGGDAGRKMVLPETEDDPQHRKAKKSAHVKLKATVKADSKSLTLYTKAQENEQQGKLLVAETYYKQALAALNPKTCDWKFKELIEKDLAELKKKTRGTTDTTPRLSNDLTGKSSRR